MTATRLARIITLGALAAVAAFAALSPSPSPAVAEGVAAIAAGSLHTCALTTEGGVKCWGDNVYGQLGDGTQTRRTAPVDVVGLDTGVVAIAAGSYHTCAVTGGGGLQCWGDNFFGQLGAEEVEGCPDPIAGSFPCSTTPVAVVGLESGVAAVGPGYGHTCAAMAAGGMKCWGWNSLGELGDGTVEWRATPVDVVGLSDAVAVAAGYDHTCALTSAGGVECWGGDRFGEVGAETHELCPDPFFPDFRMPCATTPLDVVELESGVVAIAAGGGHSCALTDAGGVKCWGNNFDGQLGAETDELCPSPFSDAVTPCSSVPVGAAGLESGAVGIGASRYFHTCAATASGGAKCWGYNFLGQLGDGTTTDRVIPVDVCRDYDETRGECLAPLSGVAAVEPGGFFTCALTTAGALKCWGNNSLGEFGNGTRDSEPRLTPVEAGGGLKATPTPTVTDTPTATATSPATTATQTPTQDGQPGPVEGPTPTATPLVAALPDTGGGAAPAPGRGGPVQLARLAVAALIALVPARRLALTRILPWRVADSKRTRPTAPAPSTAPSSMLRACRVPAWAFPSGKHRPAPPGLACSRFPVPGSFFPCHPPLRALPGWEYHLP